MKAIALSVVACLIVGCFGGGTGELKTYPVTGTVTYNGQPLDGATVSFWGPKAPRAATGITNEKGEFQLSAPAGDNQITITKSPTPTGEYKPLDAEALAAKNAAMGEAAMKEAAKRKKNSKDKGKDATKPLVPAIYSTITTTPLKETVTPKGPNKFDDLRLSD